MRLGISTDAAPGFTLGELARSCGHRGLRALELVEGHAHGIGLHTTAGDARSVRRLLADAGVTRVAFRPAAPDGALAPAVAELAGHLGADVVVPADLALAEPQSFLEASRWCARGGGRLVVLHETDAAQVERSRALVSRAPVGTALLGWHADPATACIASHAAAMLYAAGPLLEQVRLRGSGPESPASEGKGIGALMARLALAGYQGSIMLAPTSAETLPVWRIWLGRSSGWGCGSKASGGALFQLESSTPALQESR
jgi:hypothetical protein